MKVCPQARKQTMAVSNVHVLNDHYTSMSPRHEPDTVSHTANDPLTKIQIYHHHSVPLAGHLVMAYAWLIEGSPALIGFFVRDELKCFPGSVLVNGVLAGMGR